MTEQQYIEKLNEINEEAKKKKNKLAYDYALENSPYNIGDIIEDHYKIIKIEKIKRY
jgi:hypothetical protein